MRHNIMQVKTHEDGITYNVSMRIPIEKGWIENVKIHIWKFFDERIYDMQYEKSDGKYAYFVAEKLYLESCPLYHYYFSFEANGVVQYCKNENLTGNNSVTREECFKKSVNFNVPDWAKGAVVYQIFPDRFCKGKNSVKQPMPRRRLHENWDERPILEEDPNYEGVYNNDFFGGDFAGITEKIPYIADLGIDIVYLNPIVKSQSNHRYDAADYFQPDPYLGTVEELKHMIAEFHKYGIKVIFDAVFNHAGDDSIYYNQYGTYDSIGAYQSDKSPYYEMFERNKNGEVNTWFGYHNERVWNKYNPRFRDMICGVGGVLDEWCSWGCDGIRVDVADELTDFFMMEMHNAMQRNRPNDFFICLEVWKNPMRQDKTYISSGKEGHSTMNYYLTNAKLRYYRYSDVETFKRVNTEIHTEYPTETNLTCMNSTSTHDTPRVIDLVSCKYFKRYGENYWDIDWERIYEEEKWKKLLEKERYKYLEKGFNWDIAEDKAKETVRNEWQKAYKLTDEEYEEAKKYMKSYVTALAFEQGMFTILYGDEVGMTGIGTLLNRGTYPWGHEDIEVLEFYKKLIKTLKSESFLKTADIGKKVVNQEYEYYERYDENHKIIVILNNTNYEIPDAIPEEYRNAEILFSAQGNTKRTLAPADTIVLKLK